MSIPLAIVSGVAADTTKPRRHDDYIFCQSCPARHSLPTSSEHCERLLESTSRHGAPSAQRATTALSRLDACFKYDTKNRGLSFPVFNEAELSLSHLQNLGNIPPRLLVAGYLTTQAVAVAAWWCLLSLWPASIAWFHPGSWPVESFWAFAASDWIMLVFGSAAVAWAVATEKSFAALSLWALSGAAWYPTLYCLGVSCLTDEAWVATALMTAMAGSTLAMATIQGTPWQTPATYRATRLDRGTALLWTVLQVIIFWGTFLVILPKGIQEVEQQMSWPHFYFPGQFFVASTTIVLASILGLASGMTMATHGKGTPLPTASAAELVCSGPYHWVRNPMAVAGITQGLGVGLLMGSYSVLVYALLGAVFWHLLVRPSEEHDLHLRFGSAYDDYRQRTGLWIPGWFIDARSKQL